MIETTAGVKAGAEVIRKLIAVCNLAFKHIEKATDVCT